MLKLGHCCKLIVILVALGSELEVLSVTSTIRAGHLQPRGAQLPLWGMSEAGLDHKYGVGRMNHSGSKGAAGSSQTLVAGNIDRATSGEAIRTFRGRIAPRRYSSENNSERFSEKPTIPKPPPNSNSSLTSGSMGS